MQFQKFLRLISEQFSEFGSLAQSYLNLQISKIEAAFAIANSSQTSGETSAA